MAAERPYEGQAQIEIGVAAAEFPASPGSTTTVPVPLSNRGTAEDVVTLAVDGVPSEWLTKPARGESSDGAYELEGIKTELDVRNARLDAIQVMLADGGEFMR